MPRRPDTTILTAGPESAPPLVMLHGWGASKEIWTLLFRDPLAAQFRLIALDLPGTGRVGLSHRATGEGLADWVAAEMTRLGYSRFAILGHSMGANIATHLAIRHPNSVSALVLVSPALHSDRLINARWYLHRVTGPATLAAARVVAGLAGTIENRLPPTEYLGWTRGYMRRSGYLMFNNNLPGLRAQLEGLLASPVKLNRVAPDLPVLIIHGEKDSTIPVKWSRECLGPRPRNTRLLIYPRALHCPMDTDTDQFCSDVAEFLSHANSARV
jgi:pimeloyl-ACP methyl ester carboxylesterase